MRAIFATPNHSTNHRRPGRQTGASIRIWLDTAAPVVRAPWWSEPAADDEDLEDLAVTQQEPETALPFLDRYVNDRYVAGNLHRLDGYDVDHAVRHCERYLCRPPQRILHTGRHRPSAFLATTACRRSAR